MDVLIERCAGLDVHRDTVMACVRFPAEGGRGQQIHEFGTTTAELLALRDWLSAYGVTVVGMESTGVYWKPVFYVLEDAFTCHLLNARHLKNVPGRKTDVKDAEWIAQLVEHGLVRPSFVPPKPIRELRNLTRYRKAQIEERTREAQRLDKILQDAGVKLSSVATNVLGVSARAMLQAMVEGTRDPGVLAELARGRLRAKIPALKEALNGRFGPHHALLVGTILSKLEFLEEVISHLSQEISEVIAPFEPQVELLETIPGVDRRSAESILAEVGVDMAQFGSSSRLASWAGMCPGNNESAGKHRSGKTRKGSKWLRTTLTESAKAGARSKGTYFSAQHARLRGRRGPGKATIAVGHSILVVAYHVLDQAVPYEELGADYFLRRHDPQPHANKLVRQLKALGYDVKIQPVEAA
ncbi:MAG TPA: IS110 family transposase [Longimicrobiales bacterium]|jgi:transposase|nr:IS110 family transposase [Longimicrobiales bacterium]